MQENRPWLALALMLGGALSFYASGARVHHHSHHDCEIEHVEADRCDCRTILVEQEDRNKNGRAELEVGPPPLAIIVADCALHQLVPSVWTPPTFTSRDPPSQSRIRAPPAAHS
jgi:hypothetical protein